MIDAVLSYHMNPLTCGVAKFNQQLAQRLGVPFDSYRHIHRFRHPLVSLKATETPEDFSPGDGVYTKQQYDLLLHDRPSVGDCAWGRWRAYAMRVLYADEIGCVSTIQGNVSRGGYRVLTFGMAHKLVIPHFACLKEQLDRYHPDYTLALSTAVHEGTPWDGALKDSTDAMREIFGDRLRVLGFLADDALAKELQECDAVAMYFSPALRANNTSYWAAVEAGKTIYTNRDELSPKPSDPPPSWDALTALLRGETVSA
jgi:hypothetical protein